MGLNTQIGTVTGFEIRKNKDGDTPRPLLQVKINSPDDVQTVELVAMAGFDSIPPNGSTVIILPVSESYKVAIAVNDKIEPVSGAGENEIYSSAAGVKKARIKVKSSGGVAIVNDAQSAEALFDEMFDIIKAAVTVGSASTQVFDGATQAAIDGVKAKFAQLFESI